MARTARFRTWDIRDSPQDVKRTFGLAVCWHYDVNPHEIPDENPGHELKMATLFSSMNHDAEMEAMALHGMLEANGIESTVVGPSTIPSVEFQVQVPRSQLAEAEKLLADARETGPAAAEEAEAAQELGGSGAE